MIGTIRHNREVQKMSLRKAEMITQSALVTSDPEILGGAQVFAGTRVHVTTLFDYLAAGDPLDRFLDHFPTVRREQAVQLLEQLRERFET